ncbi:MULTISPECIES: alanine racemase [unclassified Gemella]|uniref:alanine racemase n=1 Tax=unclassified Gemella TaxID=2624949 RepID=UPI0015D015B0|nr:alanine racemase [Gemella sp. GL1.1]NYS27370.1 alanine racemase [Gemella sp. GL1]
MAELEIDYKKIAKNINQFKLNKEKIIAVVKNNAYNMDLEDSIRTMYQTGIRYFATTSLNEAISIRKILKDVDIFLINPTYKFEEVKKYDIEINISSLNYLKENYENLSGLKLHMEYAGFMNRSGVKNLEEAIEVIKFSNENNLILKALWCHFAHADEFDGNYEIEKSRILNIYEELCKIHKFEVKHFQNSASYLRDGIFEIASHIRPGIMLYGAYPYDVKKNPTKEVYKPYQTFEVRAKVLNIRELDKNDSIGYCNSYIANKKTCVAIADIGYGDGILRSRLTGKTCIINGREYEILSVMMSHIVVEIDKDVKIGDQVIIYNDNLPIYSYNKYCNSNSEQMAVLNKNSLHVIKKY